MTDAPELHLFILWPKARHAEARILADIAAHVEIVWQGDLRFAGDAALAYRRFYGPALPDEKRKARQCGGGAFRVVVVRDRAPRYGRADDSGRRPAVVNLNLLDMKLRYRTWAGKGHRVHGTLTPDEFARDVAMLTGRTADDWARGVPPEPFAPVLPDGWTAESTVAPFARGAIRPGPAPRIDDARVFLENKYINNRFEEGTWHGRPCVVKHSAKAVWSIGNEYRLTARMHAAAPTVVPMPFAWHFAGDGRRAWVAVEKIAGPSLADLLARGLSETDADRFAADLLTLADALTRERILHRDLFPDNLLLGADGHLKAIDWQLAVERDLYREDPWVTRHWKFHYVVFGVNRDLGVGVWNDFRALVDILARFPQTAAVRATAARLAADAPAMTFARPPKRWTRLRLRLYAGSLRVQMFLNRRRPEKYARLERRWRTIRFR